MLPEVTLDRVEHLGVVVDREDDRFGHVWPILMQPIRGYCYQG
jgi:hypothetical protein